MTAPAPHGETGNRERAPLTALEWLRVTHAGTLSGRRIEEAVAAAEERGQAEALRQVIDEVACDPRMQIYVGMLRERIAKLSALGGGS